MEQLQAALFTLSVVLPAIICLHGILSGDLVNVYFGASGIRYSRYLAGTLIGLFPSIVIFFP